MRQTYGDEDILLAAIQILTEKGLHDAALMLKELVEDPAFAKDLRKSIVSEK